MRKKRYSIVFTLIRPFIMAYLYLFHGYRPEPMKDLAQGEAAFILANHNATLDPLYVAASFNRPIFFVASDHIFRLGIISKVLTWLVNPIPIVKSQLDLTSLRRMREAIQEGQLVGLFPEGNRSFSGLPTYISPSTGKLLKQFKCSLILYRLDGAYLTDPRWSGSLRRGRMTGRVVKYLSSEEIVKMSWEEIYDIIIKYLSVDAFEHQRENKIAYLGKKLAEHLELVLFICPYCHELDKLESKGDFFACKNCGYRVRYNEYGFFEAADANSKELLDKDKFFDNVGIWYNWQREVLPEILSEKRIFEDDYDDSKPIFLDSDQVLILSEKARRSIIKGKGKIALYRDRLVFYNLLNEKDKEQQKEYEFSFDSIIKIVVHGPKTLQIAKPDNEVWEVKSQTVRSAYKYILVFETIRNMRGESHGFFSI